jgi:hypothetical protein
MYIEMTSFAIPTFVITVAKAAAVLLFVYVAVVIIALVIYSEYVGKTK